MNYIIWMPELLMPSLYFSLCEYQTYAIGEIRIEPFKNETEAEGLVLISFFLCLSVSLSFDMKMKMQEWKRQHNIRKTCLTSFTTTVTNWLNSTCHPTLKTEDLALRKRNKTQNKTEQKTIQSNCELM